MDLSKQNPAANKAKVEAYMDGVIASAQLKNDAALSRFVHIKPPVISKLRHGKFNFNANHVLKFYLATGQKPEEIMAAVGLDINEVE